MQGLGLLDACIQVLLQVILLITAASEASICEYTCRDSALLKAGPILTLNCTQSEFSVTLTEWRKTSYLVSLHIECESGMDKTCAAVSGMTPYETMGLPSYSFSQANDLTANSTTTYTCTVFGCYQRSISIFRIGNSSCDLQGVSEKINTTTANIDIDTEIAAGTGDAQDISATDANDATNASGKDKHLLLKVLVPVAILILILYLLCAFTCNLSLKNRETLKCWS